jgi:malonate transporter
MQNLIITLNIIAPVFLIVFLGIFLKRLGLIHDDFIKASSKIVFTVALPALLFIQIARTDFGTVLNLKQILFSYAGVLASFIFSWIISLLVTKNGRDQGAFIQGSFRGNFAILGFAMIANAFGSHALGQAAILLAFVMPLYNILAIIALTVPMHQEKKVSLKKTILEIAANPLILASVLALPFSYFKIPLHQIITNTVDSLAALTIPLALLSIGGSLSFTGIAKDLRTASIAGLTKLIVVPLAIIIVAIKLGFTGVELGILFFFFAAPSAVASFIMAEALGSNSRLAGNIVLMTTLVSVVTLSTGLFVLKSMGYF